MGAARSELFERAMAGAGAAWSAAIDHAASEIDLRCCRCRLIDRKTSR
ncbi:hypothetical protein XHC_1368 [Xanthomonas hortorum pv. carotae str. M081]|nr:hypothetical protein XHC_1368 [Xanthomonas hortorum pv. carotae str. M081]